MKMVSETTWAVIIASVMATSFVVGIGVAAWAAVEVTTEVTESSVRARSIDRMEGKECPVKVRLDRVGAEVYMPSRIMQDPDSWAAQGCVTRQIEVAGLRSLTEEESPLKTGRRVIPMPTGAPELPTAGAQVQMGRMPTAWLWPGSEAVIVRWDVREPGPVG